MNQNLIFSNDKTHFLIIGIICLLVIILMAHQLNLPGPMLDNVRNAKYIHQWYTDSYSYVDRQYITIFDTKFLLPSYYNGPNSLYLLYFPTVSILGLSITTVRIIGIEVVLLIIIFTYLFSREFLNKDVALITTSILAFMPATIYFGKFALWPDFILAFYFMAMLYFMVKWKHTQKRYYLFLGFLFLGLGISEKINFLWVIIGIIVSFFVFRPKLQINIKNILVATSSTVIGSILLIVAWAKYHSKFIELLLIRTGDTPRGHSNSAIFDNIVAKISDFNYLLNGGNFVWIFGAGFSNMLFPIFFFISVVFLLLSLVWFKNSLTKKTSFLLLIFFVMASLTIFSVTVTASAHLLIFLPIISMIIAIFIVNISDMIKLKTSKNYLKPTIIVSLTLLLIVSNLLVIFDYKQVLEERGGIFNHSIAMYDVAEYLVENNFPNVVGLDSPFRATLYVASEGKIDPKIVRLLPGESESNYEYLLKPLVDDPDTIYLRYIDDRYPPKWDKSEKLNNVLERMGKKIEIIKEFPDYTGKPLFFAFKITDKNQNDFK